MSKAKRAFHSLAFSIMWLIFCVIVTIVNPEKRTMTSLFGAVAGALFLWATGYCLLLILPRGKQKTWQLAVIGVGLIVVDLTAKMLVAAYLSEGKNIPILGDWLNIKYTPNYNNSVLLNIFDILMDSRLYHVMATLFIPATVGFIMYCYCRYRKYNMQDNRFRWGCTLIIAACVTATVETIFRGHILDYISFSGLVGFDLKDLYVTYGLGLLIIVLLQWENGFDKKKKARLRSKSE